MNTIIYRCIAIQLLLVSLLTTALAQTATNCDPTANQPITGGELLINYGSATNVVSFRNRSSYTIAQPLVGYQYAQPYSSQDGFWARFLMPPQAPAVVVSQGDFPDRVLIRWALDPLSSEAKEGYVVLRDGAFLAQVGQDITQFVDFNVQAGEFYEYSVYGRNQFGSGVQGRAVGFVNPNGIVTGKLETFSGNPVIGAVVKLTPTIGRSLHFDGVSDYLCVTHLPVVPTNMWTVSAWVKIDDGYNRDGIIDLGSDLNKNFWLHTTPAGSGKGVIAGVGNGSAATTLTHVFTDDPNGWHQVTAVYNGISLLLYIDGSYVSSIKASIANEDALFTIGSRRNQTGFFHGRIDDVRLFNAPLTSTQIFLTRDLTVSKSTANLVAYWKFDEGLGVKAFDISDNDMHAFINGAGFSSDAAPVTNAGFTDSGGFYTIEGVNYSQAQTFTATPVKNFYSRYALEFNAAYSSYATLTDFDLPDTATVEINLHPFDLQSRQVVLSKGDDDFVFGIENNNFFLTIKGETQVVGPATTAYQHLSFTLDAYTGQVVYYKDGELQNTLSYSDLGGEWTGDVWQLGAAGSPAADFYTGLLDEVAFYHSLLSVANIQLNASPFGSGGTDVANPYLLSYFSLDEGEGTELIDYGPLMSGIGTVYDAPFSIITYRQEATPNLFQPSQRIINVNESSTAASGIDFVNQSTVTISGVVRFENTFCYQEGVELLVNGAPYFPPVFTDANGRFVADFEPGVTVTLTPRYSDHVFSPGFFQVRRLNRPVAGVLFQNQVKREVSGQLAGGHCRLSVIPDGSVVKVKAQALNDCYYQELTLDNPDGKFLFRNLPPIPMAISVIEHSNNIIYDYFQVQGGKETDLRLIEKDTIDFIYIAPPNVLIQPFEENGCAGSGLKMIEQSGPDNGNRKYKTNVQVYERYDGGDCFLDSFRLTINNEIADLPGYTVDSDTAVYTIEYWAGPPNITGTYEKFLQVTAEVNGSQATSVERVVVLGERSREATFTTATPAMPLIILRDPPGDGSSATLAQGSTYCHAWSNAAIASTTASAGINIDLGTKVTTYAGSPFGGVITETEAIVDLDITASATAGFAYTNSAEVCVTNDVAYSTSSGDIIVGEDADLYVGAAVNFEFSSTDVLGFDPDSCAFTLGSNLRVWPDGFGTKYVYSQYQIIKDVIPSLELIGDTVSANTWRRIIDYNKRLKERAAFKENISFDALASYTQTQATSESNSEEFVAEVSITAGLATAIGLEVLGVGTTATFSIEISGGYQHTENFTNQTSRSVGFTLADDDLGDNFTVDILDDPVFGTPVFRLRSGESSCPHEPNTRPREGVTLTVDQLVNVNVPENDPAVFNFTIGNTSQTDEWRYYTLELWRETNPLGAEVRVQGTSSSSGNFLVEPGGVQNVVVTVERGPEAYDYENLLIYATSACEGARYDALNEGNFPPEPFFEGMEISAFFLEPCSPIDIGFPLQDWVVTPDDGNILFITLNEYIYDDPDLDIVRVQYRRTGGDGSWINIAELPAAEFANSPVFKIVQWDMSDLVDGAYEIRAVSQCFDVSLNPGISPVIKGRKETQPPQLFGTPQPGDGVLNPGDEISVTFSKRVRCDRIFPADGIGTNVNINSLALQDMSFGGILIDATISCNNDKIVIVPNIPNQFIENHTLRATVAGIEDLYGNAIPEPIAWEFLVNRNNLFWEEGRIDEFVFEGSTLTVTRKIRNQGGSVTSFNIVDIPAWMEVFPTNGNVIPGDFAQITFRFPADIVGGLYNTTLQMITPQGPEPLQVDLRVACPDPAWTVNAQAYSYTMNMTVQLNIEGELSSDRLDLIGAFVGDELRGAAYVQYVRELDRYLAYMTIYSNEVSGETVNFRIWDASTCLLYGHTLESFPFETNDLIGSPLVPQVIHTNNLVRVAIPIYWGWNWISYNVNLPDPSINTALASLTVPQGATIKGQTAFSQYFNAGNLWAGSLENLSHLTMYQYRSNGLDSIVLLGNPVNLGTTTIPIVQGWNWISYLPQQGMTIDSALQSLVPLNGDIIKSQTTFAQYVAGVGWLGNMSFMRPTQGYLLRLSNPGTLQYPPRRLWDEEAVEFRSAADPELMSLSEHWIVNPTEYEHTMNVIALVHNSDAENILSSDTEVAAFMEGQVRGAAKPVYIEALDAWLLFLTVYSNDEGDMLSFRLYDESAGAEYALNGQQVFIANRIAGSIDQPVVLTLGDVTEVSEPGIAAGLRVFPNPARERVFVRFEAAQAEEVLVRVTDALGRQVAQMKHAAHAGENTLEWAPAGLARGLYTLSLHSGAGVQTVRVEFQ